MRSRYICGFVLGGAAVGSTSAWRRYRRHLDDAQERLRNVQRTVIPTEFGALEYAAGGTGAALLVSHGIFHGCDGGLRSVRDTVPDRRVIVPSRFGYLGSTLAKGATVADQADAFVALLDHLDLTDVDVIGISAGTGAAIQLAIRHPDRVGHLVISSGNFPGSPTASAPPTWAKVFYSDPAMWLMKVFAEPMFRGMMGVPKGFPRDATEERVVAEMMESILPIGPRVQGAIFDAFVSNPEIGAYALEALDVPTLVIHAKDDPLASYSAAERAAERIPGSALVGLDSGGHLMLGQTDRVRNAIADFLTG